MLDPHTYTFVGVLLPARQWCPHGVRAGLGPADDADRPVAPDS